MTHVEVTCFLIIGANLRGEGKNAYHVGKANVRVSKGSPSLAPNEIPIRLSFSLPVALFQRPALEAKIEIPAEAAPFVITPAIQEGITDAIRQASGMNVALTVSNPPV